MAAITALTAALAWDLSTPDFWETGPILGSVFLVGLLGGLSVYMRRGNAAFALGAALGSATLTFIATLFVALAWAS